MVTEYHGPGNLSKSLERLHVKFVGGRLCLDFVNTVGGRDGSGSVIRDKLGCYEDLVAWSVPAAMDGKATGVLAALGARDPGAAAKVMGRAVRLRESLYRIFKSVADGRRPKDGDMEALRGELSMARAAQRLAAQAHPPQAHQPLAARGTTYAWVFADPPDSLERVLWPVALSAGELLTSGDLTRVRQCAGENCGWLFVDSSRNHRRQWCDMRDCGNRAKVRRYRQQRSGAR